MSSMFSFSAFSHIKKFQPKGKSEKFFNALEGGEKGLKVSQAVKENIQKYIADYKQE